jgi:integrase
VKGNPVDPAIKKKKVKAGPPPIVTPTELTRLLNVADEMDGELVPYLALQAFAGMRTEETDKIEWQAIRLPQGLIDVSAHVAKGDHPRWTKIEPCLYAWLSKHRKTKGRVRVTNHRKRLEAVRRAAGFDSWQGTHNNALRHSYASYHLAKFSDAGRTREEMGHLDESSFRRDYVNRVLPADGEAFWEIAPVDANEKVVAL